MTFGRSAVELERLVDGTQCLDPPARSTRTETLISLVEMVSTLMACSAKTRNIALRHAMTGRHAESDDRNFREVVVACDLSGVDLFSDLANDFQRCEGHRFDREGNIGFPLNPGALDDHIDGIAQRRFRKRVS